MDVRGAETLGDNRYVVPPVAAGQTGMAWLRSHVVRFAEGALHDRRRVLTESVIAEIATAPLDIDPTTTLLTALGLSGSYWADVAVVATAYQPHFPQSYEADSAADRLVEACGGRTEAAAARVCVLVQAHGATPALIERLRSGSDQPPVPVTRRIGPDGVEVEVDLQDAPFGRGIHHCPGESLARRLAQEALK